MKNFTNRREILSIFTLFLFLFFLPSISRSQQCDTENWVYPFPQGNKLTYVDFTSPTTGYATGLHGTIMKTTNGGNTWTMVNTGTTTDLYQIQFINSNVGIAAGAKGTILKTINGGTTWVSIQTGILSDLTALHFPSFNIGYATAADGSILKSTDNGTSWTLLNSGTTETLKSIFFTSNTTGIAVGGSTIPGPRNSYHSYMTRTTDGGITWTPYVLPRNIPLTKVTFFNDQNGITAGGHPDGSHAAPEGTVLKTSDGGLTWQEVFYGNQAVNSFDFAADQLIGLATGNYGTIKTLDGGNTWSILNYDNTNFSSLSMVDPSTALEVGEFGRIRKSIDGGISWLDQSESLTYSPLSSLQFTDPATGYAIANNETATLVKTVDGGTHWKKIVSGLEGNFTSLFFTNSTTGYVTSYNYPNYEILKTNDGGNSWTIVNSTPSYYLLRDVSFVSANTGVAVGENGIILRTTNKGLTWNPIPSNTTLALTSIEFFNKTKGVIVGSGGILLKTSDGGSSWTQSNGGITESLNSINVIDKNTGFAVGDAGIIVRTNNAGRTWMKINTSYSNSLSDVNFIDSNTGYIASSVNGDILKSVDGGMSWNVLPSITYSSFHSLAFPFPGTGYVSGSGGTLLKITTCDSITGPVQVLKGNSHYRVPSYSGLGYEWSISGGGHVTSSGNIASVSWNKIGKYTLTCKPSAGKTMTIEVRVSDRALANLGQPENSSINQENVSENNIQIFPNPSNGSFAIRFTKEGNYSVVISNALGTEVYKTELHSQENSIKLPGHLKGLFYLRINSEEGTSIQKIVVE
jgi:photosystem II stability/assembly factor-like uncharacterized protein